MESLSPSKPLWVYLQNGVTASAIRDVMAIQKYQLLAHSQNYSHKNSYHLLST